jgi:hypothetical protein
MSKYINDATKLSKFVEEINDLARKWNITPLTFTLPNHQGEYLMTSVEFGIEQESPPPLGIHVTDGLAGKDKVGG